MLQWKNWCLGSGYLSIRIAGGKVSIWERDNEHEQPINKVQRYKVSLVAQNISNRSRFYQMLIKYWPNLKNRHWRGNWT